MSENEALRQQVSTLTAALEQAEIARARAWDEGVKDERVRAEADLKRVREALRDLVAFLDRTGIAKGPKTDGSGGLTWGEPDELTAARVLSAPPPGTEAASTALPATGYCHNCACASDDGCVMQRSPPWGGDCTRWRSRAAASTGTGEGKEDDRHG